MLLPSLSAINISEAEWSTMDLISHWQGCRPVHARAGDGGQLDGAGETASWRSPVLGSAAHPIPHTPDSRVNLWHGWIQGPKAHHRLGFPVRFDLATHICRPAFSISIFLPSSREFSNSGSNSRVVILWTKEWTPFLPKMRSV